MLQSERYRNDFVAFITEMIDKGYAEKVPHKSLQIVPDKARCVLESIPEEERSKDVKTLDLNYDDLPIERALGIQWCVEPDTFKFRITVKDKPVTRRRILSVVSSIYDPLGFAAPFTLTAKKLLQDLCREERLNFLHALGKVAKRTTTARTLNRSSLCKANVHPHSFCFLLI